ncbi:MAG TPA: hypothetical protein VMW28_00170 [Pelolinea sp.]|nr:hypothetical protein [Pelolinea sp.]
MEKYAWFKTFPGAIMATDAEGIISDMNDQCAGNYTKDGGYGLLGSNAIDCHQGAALEKARRLWDEKVLNVYTLTKNGRKKLIYQAPYFVDGEFAGMVEMSLPLPDGEMPHFNRDKPQLNTDRTS